jgi:beta-lactamase class A
MNIKERINEIVEKNPSCGILVIGNDGKVQLEHNSEKAFSSASVIKLYILSYYLDKKVPLDKKIPYDKSCYMNGSIIKELDLSDLTLYELLTHMIAHSDNTATNILIDYAGRVKINNYIQDTLCVKNTALQRHMLDFDSISCGIDNYTCADDTVMLLQRLSQNPEALDILGKQKCVNRLMRYIYSGVKFYGKAGEIPSVFNDVGILKTGKETAFAAVLTNNINSDISVVLCGLCGLLAVGSDNVIY